MLSLGLICSVVGDAIRFAAEFAVYDLNVGDVQDIYAVGLGGLLRYGCIFEAKWFVWISLH